MIHWQIQRFEQLDSTQTWLQQRASQLPEGTVVVAEQQLQGHGRASHNWLSEAGGLYVSWLLKPERLLPELPWVLLLAVCRALETETGFALRLKAPNDLLLQGRKLAGMLIDGAIQGERPLFYVCGLGVNLNQRDFSDLPEATSLWLASGQRWSETKLLQTILAAFATDYQLF